MQVQVAPTTCVGCGNSHPPRSLQCPASRLGRVVDGQYRLESILGMGGIGVVYGATDLALKQPVALKMLLASFGQDTSMQERFRREALAAARVHAHPGIVRVLRVGVTHEGDAYLVMERLEGDTLRSWFNQGPRTLNRLLWAVTSLLDVLHYAHSQGLVHRDLKPSNLYVCRVGSNEHVKILDFGIVQLRWEELEALTQTGTFLGSVYYTSPEQLMDSKSVKPQADLYSMGAVLYNLLTRQMVVSAPNAQMEMVRVVKGQIARHPRQLVKEVPLWLDALVAQCLHFDPAQRPTSALALSQALREGARADVLSLQGVLANPEPVEEALLLDLDEATSGTSNGTFSMTQFLRGMEETRADTQTSVALASGAPLISGQALPLQVPLAEPKPVSAALLEEPRWDASLLEESTEVTELSVVPQPGPASEVPALDTSVQRLTAVLLLVLIALIGLLGLGVWRIYAG